MTARNDKGKAWGCSGGHNVLRSVDSAIGKAYWRVRFGIERAELCNLSTNASVVMHTCGQ
ncbi:MAG: hypothetical protein PV344_01500 [Anaplasma sp.]|nr:hypothetical protein [Anaplasma sp.]